MIDMYENGNAIDLVTLSDTLRAGGAGAAEGRPTSQRS